MFRIRKQVNSSSRYSLQNRFDQDDSEYMSISMTLAKVLLLCLCDEGVSLDQ